MTFRPLSRGWTLVGGGVLGLLASLFGPGLPGCIYHDTCIKVTSSGHDWCRHLANAVQWPAGGGIDDAEPVLDADNDTPKGCRCFNDVENLVLDDEVPACHYEQLLEELEQAARQECQSLVLPGYDHNCWTISGPDASVPEDEFFDGQGSCIGNCEYGGGSCPDPNPYECATGDGGPEGCEPEGGSGSPTSGGDGSGGSLLDPKLAIACDGTECEIDEDFAQQLYDDPSPLVAEGTQLVYDRPSQRHVFAGITPSTIAHTLGLRTGDRLEHVGYTVIDGLEAALRAYVDHRETNPLHVRVQREDQWVDFTYTFVP